jgi:hypothetical protein
MEVAFGVGGTSTREVVMKDDEKETHTIIPAGAGWFVGLLIESDGEVPAYFLWEGIIAWHLERRESQLGRVSISAEPITADDGLMRTHGNEWLIREPSGRLFIANDTDFVDEEEAIKSLSARAARKWERERAKAKGI